MTILFVFKICHLPGLFLCYPLKLCTGPGWLAVINSPWLVTFDLIAKHLMLGSLLVLDWFRMVGVLQYINDFCKNGFAYELVMSLALPYDHIPPIFTFTTLPIEPDCTTATAMQYDPPCNPHNLAWPMLTSTHTQHYHRHSIILVIGFRHSTQALHLTAPFMPHMTLLGFMCPGLGKSIRYCLTVLSISHMTCCHCLIVCHQISHHFYVPL